MGTTGTVSTGPRTLSIDIGGTGIKMLVLDSMGDPVTERGRELTPHPATPQAVLASIAPRVDQYRPFDRVSVGFPGVVFYGVVKTAPNLGTEDWAGRALQSDLAEMVGKPVRVINDADLQGYGVVSGKGLEMVLTLGTGLGAALFIDGRLVPNLELGHHPFRDDKTYEDLISDRELDRIGKKKWSRRIIKMLEQLEPIFNYERIFIGGGNAKKIKLPLPDNAIVFDNVQGMRGGIRLWERLD
jgi:polyphosphate glucokinase